MPRISWTSMQTFMSCQRKYELAYIEGLTAKPSTNSTGLFFGTAIHAGIHEYLLSGKVSLAIRKAEDTLRSLTPPAVSVYNPVTKQHVLDQEFYEEMRLLHLKAGEVLRFYLPQLGIGTKYRVISVGEMLGHGPEYDIRPVLELNVQMGDIQGIVDAVLEEINTGERVVFDWKTRQALGNETLAMVDGQLHLYAAMLRNMGAVNITKVCMVEFKTSLPKPVELSAKDKQPLTGRASYDTTWEYWVSSLPAGIDPAKYEEVMKPKMKRIEDFMRFTEMPVTDVSDAEARRNAEWIAKLMREVDVYGEPLPAVLGSNACKFCPFARLCAGPLRYGGDVESILDIYYDRGSSVPSEDFAGDPS